MSCHPKPGALSAGVVCAARAPVRRPPTRWLLVLTAALAGCPGTKATPQIACFTRTAGGNSPQTRALFAERQCQGGSATWAELLRVLARRLGRVAPASPTPRGWSGPVSTLDGAAHFTVTPEGDAARLCADDAQLLDALRTGAAILNDDPRALRQALEEASAQALDCAEPPDAGAPTPASKR